MAPIGCETHDRLWGRRIGPRLGAWKARLEGACARWIPAGAVVVCASATAVISVAVARAEGCPNEGIRGQETYASALPDCRAYEQVSPVEKSLTDAAGKPGIVQAAPLGEAVSFFSVAPFPGAAGSAGQAPSYVSTRLADDGGWGTRGLLPAAVPGTTDYVRGLSEDLANSLVLTEEPSESGMPVRNAYEFDTSMGGPGRLIGANLGTRGKLSFVDATPGDTHVLFEANAQLTPNAAEGAYNLYERDDATGAVTLAGAQSDGEAPAGGAVAGPGGPAIGPLEPGGSASEFYTQNTISEDGARIFFTASESGTIYMREPEAGRTIQISAGEKPAYWRAATPSGSFVLYTEGEDLYRFNVDRFQSSGGPEAQALAEAREPLAGGAAGVLGTLGMSDDGSYVYFVATDELANNENGDGEAAEVGADNLYEWHDTAVGPPETIFIARLLGPSGESRRDEPDWRGYYKGEAEGNGPSGGEKSSRLTPDGSTLLFSSVAKLTSYENAGQTELYLYDAEQPLSPDNPACVSCNPRGAPALDSAYLTKVNGSLAAAPASRNAFMTRNLSADGDRVFFQTEEALVSADTNGQMDVYEWERAGANAGEPGSCETSSPTFDPKSGGCLYLISSGQSDAPSYFGDASEDGDDVFFFTRQALVGQDRDDNADLYDARVDGGIAAQNPVPASTSCAEEACRPESPVGQVFEAPSSLTIVGTGNVSVASSSSKVEPAPTRVQRLAKALGKCRKRRVERKRHACEARARRQYGPSRKPKGRRR